METNTAMMMTPSADSPPTTAAANGQTATKTPIETLSKEEIISKYKGLLAIAKKAKQAKDELVEENRALKEALSRSETQKEADNKALLTMKEMLEQFTENKLQLTSQLSELHHKSRIEADTLNQLRIENESLKRQLNRLTEENESLLHDIDHMDNQLKQVNVLGIEQKKDLSLLELEVNRLKEAESRNASIQSQLEVVGAENKSLKDDANAQRQTLDQLQEKYARVKEINAEQRSKFKSLKVRFVEVHRKLTKLKECKRVLLETQHEYADAVSKWQREIISASRMLCAQLAALKRENDELQRREERQEIVTAPPLDVNNITTRLGKLQRLAEAVYAEHRERNEQLDAMQADNKRLQELIDKDHEKVERGIVENDGVLEKFRLDCKRMAQELYDLKTTLEHSEQHLRLIQLENDVLKEKLCQQAELQAEMRRISDELIQYKTKDDESAEKPREENAKERDAKDRQESEMDRLRAALQSAEQENARLLLQQKMTNAALPKEEDDDDELRQSYEELAARYEQKEREHADLLGEMRELNEALKGRGDVISRQQEKQQELLGELKRTAAKLQHIEEQLAESEGAIAAKDAQVHDILCEIDAAHRTIAELETNCMKNQEQVRQLSDELHHLRSAAAQSLEARAVAGGPAETMAVDAQSDVLSTSTISRADEPSRLRDIDESFEEKYNKLRGLAVKLKRKLQEQSAELEQRQSANKAAHQELDESRRRCSELTAERGQSEKQLESLRAEVQKLKSTRKQANNVLNLEIEAAEKSLSEVTAKLAVKNAELESVVETLARKEATVVQLRKEIVLLEEAKEAECQHSKQLKEQMDLLQTQVKDAVHKEQATLATSKALEQAHESLKLEVEELRLLLAETSCAHEAAVSTANVQRLQLEQQLLEAEEALKRTRLSLQGAERALEDLRVEHLDYKAKAQAVLRKNQHKDASRERELEEELLALRAVEQRLQAQALTLLRQREEHEQAADAFKEEIESLQRRGRDLRGVVDELRQENDHLALEARNQMHQQQESLRRHRQQIETLDMCHKEQMQTLEANHKRQLDQLYAEVSKGVRLPPTVGGSATATTLSKSMTLSQQIASGGGDQTLSKIDFLLMEREDAEGSDEAADASLAALAANRKISNASRRSQHDFMPLDELLNAPMNTLSSDTVTTLDGGISFAGVGIMRSDSVDDASAELQAMRDRLSIQESRVRHLTVLLAENEQDLAKLTQMNDMLKEELRRQERSVEREQHMHNSEYLKNVIIKFITLNNSDERTRLVPVLNTILKLSRSEADILTCVAKGQKDPSNRGWGNFLPSWSNNNSNN